MKQYRGQAYYLDRDGYYRKGNWPFKIALHERIWTDNFGEIPKGYIVAHLDGNRQNNDITNLTCGKPEVVNHLIKRRQGRRA